MLQRSRTLKLLAALLPAGALGMSIALAPEAAQAAPAKPASTSVALRLQAIRDAVSTVAASTASPYGTASQSDPNILKAWWRNGWGNWHPGWGNGWHNLGWGNGWHNAAWNNWHNWANGWHNW